MPGLFDSTFSSDQTDMLLRADHLFTWKTTLIIEPCTHSARVQLLLLLLLFKRCL